MPYLQIGTDTWACIRESLETPKAIIKRVTDRQQCEKYMLFTWHEDPSRRRLHGIYDTLEQANHVVRWNVKIHHVPTPDSMPRADFGRHPSVDSPHQKAREREDS